MSELIAIYFLGFAYGTVFGLLIAFMIWYIKYKTGKEVNNGNED